MTGKKIMIILMLSLIFVLDVFVKNTTAFDSLMTYTVRLKKFNFYPNVTGNIIIDYYKNKHYINGDMSFNFEESINLVTIIFHRCNQEGINCEYFQTWTLKDICHKIREKNQVWSSILKSLHPPITCPFRKHYQIKNATIDIDPFFRWYPDVANYQWKILFKLQYDNLFLGSVKYEFSIFGYRKRIKSITL